MNILSFIVFLPLIVLVVVLALPERFRQWNKYIVLGTTLIQLVAAIWVYNAFDPAIESGVKTQASFQFVEKLNWIQLDLGSLGKMQIEYFMGVDGISVGFLLLSAIVMVIAALSSWEIKDKLKGYFALFLLLDTAIIGVFLSLDFFLFYVFYELMLFPLYFLIGIWGGPRREYAAIKFFLYTLAGSVFMLLVIVGLGFSATDPLTGAHTFNMLHLMNPVNYGADSLFSFNPDIAVLFGWPARLVAFVVLFIAFAIKVPVVPFHTWLPDAHVEAPTPVSIILAGLLLKVGAYGIIRICFGIFPEGAIYFSWWIALLGVISIIYGALNALAQTDLKKLIAYSSVSHMGFVLLGIASLTTEGASGAIMQLFSHGILASMLFFLTGVLYNRVQDRDIADFKGLSTQMPRFSAFVMIAFFASLGLPGFSAFISEALVLIGSFNSAGTTQLLPRWMAMLAAGGIFLGAAYFLWTLQRMFFGPVEFKLTSWKERLVDLKPIEWAVLIPLTVLTILLGIMPSLVLDVINNSVNQLVETTFLRGSEQLNILLSYFN